MSTAWFSSLLLLSPAPLPTALVVLMIGAVVALVAWALQLMQAASDRQEFSLMLAGCMVCSAAVGLATVMLLSVTGPQRLEAARSLGIGPSAADWPPVAIDCLVAPSACPDAISAPVPLEAG